MPERIAVIIPCYNHARYVGEALDSVLAQTQKPARIIVIDDGSKDDSPKVLESFASRGVEVFTRENQGAHATLNELVTLAAQDCPYISILNSDDRYLPERLSTCLAAARQQPGKSVICTGLRVIDDHGKVMPEDAPRSRWFHGAWSIGKQDGMEVHEWLGRANFAATTSNIFARAAYLKANPFRPYRFNHDYFFLATAALENQLNIVPDVMLEYRVHGSNTIATRPEPLIREMLRMHLDLYRQHALALRRAPDMRRRFFGFVGSSWENISSFHAGLLQVALAQLAAAQSEAALEDIIADLAGPEFDEFPNHRLAGSYDGATPLEANRALSRKLDEIVAQRDDVKADKEALDRLSRYRHIMLRSKWVRLGLILGLCHPLVSNRGKKPHEKMLWLRDTCAKHWWLAIGEKLGSESAHRLRRDQL
jgi:glycosyltransferase involved in cell wall biosynthesis